MIRKKENFIMITLYLSLFFLKEVYTYTHRTGINMVKCKFCDLDSDELIWDRDYHEMTGKWRLFHQGQGRPHECQVHKLEEPEKERVCKWCAWDKRTPMKISKLQEHIKKEHLIFYLSDDEE